jgi:BirA family transcriptional regulator, biotin operon repressor / biotin---[acetyl-CoA-carboxylase] ligase
LAFFSRVERFGPVDSTQRIVREWLEAGTQEVAIAVADEQAAGRGRQGRSWTAPPGAALLLSAGFRPADLPLRHGWRLAAIVSLAMLDAAEAAAGLADSSLRLKWPNDIVAAYPDGRLEKVAGVLGESVAVGDLVGWSVVGIGVNVDWAAADFPPELKPTMTSLREMAGRPVDREQLLDEFLARLEPRHEALHQGSFDAASWSARQVTTGGQVEVDIGREVVNALATGVDPDSGALLVDGHAPIDSGEVIRCRLLGLLPAQAKPG